MFQAADYEMFFPQKLQSPYRSLDLLMYNSQVLYLFVLISHQRYYLDYSRYFGM